MRIAVVGCCQAHGYAHALAHLLPEAEVEFRRGGGQPQPRQAGGGGGAAARLRHALHPGFRRRIRPAGDRRAAGARAAGAPAAAARLRRLPPGHGLPDLRRPGAGLAPRRLPLGDHRRRLLARRGGADVPQLFNRLVYGRLGYLQGFGAARTLLLELLAGYGLDMAADFEAWHAEGPFMHGINHPRGLALADVMRAAAIRAGLLGAAAPRVRPPFDHLAADTIWPVYPGDRRGARHPRRDAVQALLPPGRAARQRAVYRPAAAAAGELRDVPRAARGGLPRGRGRPGAGDAGGDPRR